MEACLKLGVLHRHHEPLNLVVRIVLHFPESWVERPFYCLSENHAHLGPPTADYFYRHVRSLEAPNCADTCPCMFLRYASLLGHKLGMLINKI